MERDEKRQALRLSLGETAGNLNLRLAKHFVLRNKAILQKRHTDVDALSEAISWDTRLLLEILNDKIEQLGSTEEVLRALVGLQQVNAEVKASVELISNVKTYLDRVKDGAQSLEQAVKFALFLV